MLKYKKKLNLNEGPFDTLKELQRTRVLFGVQRFPERRQKYTVRLEELWKEWVQRQEVRGQVKDILEVAIFNRLT